MKQQITRRQFLKHGTLAAGAVTAPFILPGPLLKADAPSGKITMACIGVGGRGMGNMSAFLNDPRVRVRAVCDVDAVHAENAAKRVAEQYGNTGGKPGAAQCDVTADYRTLIEREDIDAVMIGTPDHTHALIAVHAMRAGKDVYCEKPLAYSVAEGLAMVRTARHFGRVLQTGTQRRSNARIRQACEAVRNGRIGRLLRVEVGLPKGFNIRNGAKTAGCTAQPVPPDFDYDKWLGPAPNAPYTPARCHFNFRWILDYGEGYISDWGAHYIDVAHWGMGADTGGPTCIEAKASFPEDGLYDAPTEFHIDYRYPQNVQLICGTDVTLGIRFLGSDGWIHVEKPGAPLVSANNPDILKMPPAPGEVFLYQSSNHHANFIDSVIARTDTAAPVEVGHASATACHLGMIAARLARKIHWNAQNQTIIDDATAQRLLERPMRHPYTL